MAERVLAHVERIHNIRPIDGADKIEQVNVLGWNLVTLKGEFKDGDLAVYIEVDSRVPSDKECFAFLEKKKYKVKSTRIRGVVSQGLALPLSILPEGNYSEGTDVTEILGITKIQEDYVAPVMSDEDKFRQHYKKIYKNPIIRFFLKHSFTRKIVFKIFLKKKKKKNWPEWVVKTDEVRVQNIPWVLENKSPFIVTEKCDGTSSTYSLKHVKKNKYEFYVCSRNVLQDTPERKCFYDDNVYWEMAKKYNIEQALRTLIGNNEWITLQGEIIGPTIQKNKYELKERELRAFNLITSQNGRVPSDKARDILDAFNIPFVPIISNNYILPDTIDELMTYSTGTSALHDTLREGIVFRNYDQNISFKCVSNDFLLKWNI